MEVLCQALSENANKLHRLYGDAHTSAARLNYYPDVDPVPSSERGALAGLVELAMGEHTDPNGVTLLYQDDAGGLQAFSDTEDWIDIPPIPYSFVVNVGDMMQAW
jgi:isopenicillin N synthase-like dioxygenase